VVDVGPERAGEAVVAADLALKRRGRLYAGSRRRRSGPVIKLAANPAGLRFMRPSGGLAALLVLAGCGLLATCVFPTERDSAVHVSVTPLKILIRGTDTTATATAWRRTGPADSQPIPNVVFVWSSSDPGVAAVDARGHITGIKSGTARIRAAAANFDAAAAYGEDTLRVSERLEIDSIRPQTVRYGETVTVYGVGVDSIFQARLGAGILIPYALFVPPLRDATGYAQARFWVPPPAVTDSLFFVGNGVFGFAHDTVRVIRRDLFEPNEIAPAVIDLDTSRPFPGTPLAFLLFLNPALSFEGLPRGVTVGADWYRFRQSAPRDLTITVSSEVPGTFQTFLTDSLGFRASDSSYFLGRNAWTFGPGSHACHGAAFAPKEATSESTFVAFTAFPAGLVDAIAVYTQPGRYALAVAEGYALSDPRIGRDAHEEDNYCDAADAKPDTLNPQVLDTLAIENPHDVDWFRVHVPGTVASLVRFRTAARPFATADSSDIDLYVLNVPAPADTVMRGVAVAAAGSTVDTTITLAPGDYYAVVVDFAGVPTRYALCIGVVALGNPNCATLPAPAAVLRPSAAAVARRARLEAAAASGGNRPLLPLRPPSAFR
jgi:hypothetical protein